MGIEGGQAVSEDVQWLCRVAVLWYAMWLLTRIIKGYEDRDEREEAKP